MSAFCLSPCTYSTSTCLFYTHSLIKWYLQCMCLLFPWNTGFLVKAIALWLSIWITTFSLYWPVTSLNRARSHKTQICKSELRIPTKRLNVIKRHAQRQTTKNQKPDRRWLWEPSPSAVNPNQQEEEVEKAEKKTKQRKLLDFIHYIF